MYSVDRGASDSWGVRGWQKVMIILLTSLITAPQMLIMQHRMAHPDASHYQDVFFDHRQGSTAALCFFLHYWR